MNWIAVVGRRHPLRVAVAIGFAIRRVKTLHQITKQCGTELLWRALPSPLSVKVLFAEDSRRYSIICDSFDIRHSPARRSPCRGGSFRKPVRRNIDVGFIEFRD